MPHVQCIQTEYYLMKPPQFDSRKYSIKYLLIILSCAFCGCVLVPTILILLFAVSNYVLSIYARVAFRLTAHCVSLAMALLAFWLLTDVGDTFVWLLGFAVGVFSAWLCDTYLLAMMTGCRLRLFSMPHVLIVLVMVQNIVDEIIISMCNEGFVLVYLFGMITGAVCLGIVQEMK